jgi:hypothetical protein
MRSIASHHGCRLNIESSSPQTRARHRVSDQAPRTRSMSLSMVRIPLGAAERST